MNPFETVEPATRRALEDLLTEFARLVDTGMADQVHTLFTEQGSITGPGLAMHSRAEIAQVFGERAKNKARVSRHLWSNPRFERLDDRTVRVTTVVQTFVHTLGEAESLPAPAGSFVIGDSIDVMEQGEDGVWRFRARELVVIFRA